MFRLLALSLFLAYMPPALAVERDYFGEGQVLLFPFFTSEKGWDTYLNIALTPNRHSILKVRVLDGEDGLVVNAFNVYTSANENWRAAIAQDDNDQPFLRVAEGFCTISDSGLFGGTGTDFPLSTLTGMIEIYEIGHLGGESRDLECDDLAAQWQIGGIWASDPLQDVQPTNNSIVGHFDLVHVEQGLSSEYLATGLKNFSDTIPHTSPQNISSPDLTGADPIAKLSNGELVEPYSGEGIDAIALLLSTNDGGMTNDVVTSEAIGASTDWVVTFPLQGYKSYGDYSLEIDETTRTCNEYVQSSNEPPLIERGINGPWTGWGGGEFTGGSPFDGTPEPIVPYSPFLCHPVNVLAFGDKPSVFLPNDSKLLTFVEAAITPLSPSSTLRYVFSDGFSAPEKNEGRPVLAFRATTFVNSTLNGGSILANYMILKPHKID